MTDNFKKLVILFVLGGLAIFFMVPYFSSYVQAKRLTKKYIHYTNPRFSLSPGIVGLIQFYFLDRYYGFRLKSLLAEDCIIESHYPEGITIEMSREDFVGSFTGQRFVYGTKRLILKHPIVKSSEDIYTVTFASAYCDGDKILIADSQLAIEKSKSAISRATNFVRDPNDSEVKKVRQITQAGRYNTGKGFAGDSPGAFSSTLCISPDGKSLIFSQRSDNKSYEIYLVDIDSGNLQRLTKTKYSEVMPFFTPDGKSIVFMSDKDSYLGEPYLINLDGSNYRRLLPQYSGVRDVIYSPDGSMIAFTVHNGRNNEIYVANTDLSNIKKLTEDGRTKSNLVFSQQSDKIYFMERWYDYSKEPPLCRATFSIDTTGLNLRQLMTDSLLLCATDKFILFCTGSVVDGGYQSELLMKNMSDDNIIKIYNGDHSNLVVSLDGKLIAFVDDINKPYHSDLYVKELTSEGKIRRITDKGASNTGVDPVFSPDDRFLAFVENSSRAAPKFREIKIVSLDDGDIRILARIEY